jgi:hypothetical protein
VFNQHLRMLISVLDASLNIYLNCSNNVYLRTKKQSNSKILDFSLFFD